MMRQMKRKEVLKQKRQAEARRRRLLIIGAVSLLAIVAAAVVITLNQPPPPVGEFLTVAPQAWPEANGKALGPANAKVVLLEYADFQCPYCRDFQQTVGPKLISQYVANGKVRLEYRHLIVIDSNVGGKESRRSAEASECASEQNKFWDYYTMLFANQREEGSGAFSDVRLKAFATTLGLDAAQFNACLDSSKYAQKVVQDETQVRALRLNSTPSLLINNVPVANPLDFTAVQAAIEAALKQAGG